VPQLLEALSKLSEVRPAKPVEWLADFLEERNMER